MGVSMNYDPAPIQHDAIMGVVETVQEMLLYESAVGVRVLPALPDRISTVKARDLRTSFGKISIDYTKDASCRMVISPNTDRETVIFYKNKKMTVNLCKNDDIVIDL
jgi:hypothetical protein